MEKQINQNINGNYNQISARDIINKGDSFTPDPNNPNVTTCYCGWAGLGIKAEECKVCGHNHEKDRLANLAIEQRNRKEALKFFVTIVLAFLAVAAQISSRTDYNFIEVLLICAFIGGILWYAWSWLQAYIKTWLKNRHR